MNRFLSLIISAVFSVSVSAAPDVDRINDRPSDALEGGTTIGALFFPLLADLETIPHIGSSPEDGLDLIANKSGDASVRSYIGVYLLPQTISYGAEKKGNGAPGCQIFSNKTWIYTRNPSGDVGGQMVIRTKDINNYNYNNQSLRDFGYPAVAGNRLSCLLIQAEIIDEAVKLLKKKARKRRAKRLGGNVYEVQDLHNAAQTAFWLAFITPSLPEKARKIHKEFFESDMECAIPTPLGLASGKTNVICGPYNFNQDAMVLKKNSVRWLSEDTIKGEKVIFIESEYAP